MDLVIFSALLVGLIQLLKVTFKISARWTPIITLLTSVVLFAVFMIIEDVAVSWEIVQNILIVALSAMGFWSGTKAIAGR